MSLLNRISGTQFEIDGYLAPYLKGVSDQWLKVAPLSNPGMLEMFRDRDRTPARDLVPWAGEFAGKYLTGAVQVLRVTGDPELRHRLQAFVAELLPLQDDDGYFGPWPHDSRLTGTAPNTGGGETWDAWGHYHLMVGLLLWWEDGREDAALSAVKAIGDLLCGEFLGREKRPRLVDTGSTEMNLAVIHGLCLLYRHAPEARYLDLALQIEEEFAATDEAGQPLAGDYLNTGLSGLEFYQTPKPRWESLHPLMSLAELYWITGEAAYRKAFEHHWRSIVRLDRHNNGGFSSGEQAQGNPYHPGAIETCCTIAWIAMSVEMLRLTGDSTVADELELSTLNSVVGLHSPTGRWATYNTPMDGVKKASAHDIVFQAREGTPELNCCSVNAARGFGMVSDWAVMMDEEGIVLNWYGPGSMTVPLANGAEVTLRQETDYPRQNSVRLFVESSSEEPFTIRLRIPGWSKQTRVHVNGDEVTEICSGQYLSLHRRWNRGDRVEFEFDFGIRTWIGERECEGKVSLYRGPLLLAYDRAFNPLEETEIPALSPTGFVATEMPAGGTLPPYLLMKVDTEAGPLFLCDFGSAGDRGTAYRSWLSSKREE